jgi:hypothetical protein
MMPSPLLRNIALYGYCELKISMNMHVKILRKILEFQLHRIHGVDT